MSAIYEDIQVFGEIIGDKLIIANEYALPITDGTIGQILTTDGAGTVSWQNGVISVNSQTGIVVLTTDDITEGSVNKYYSDTLSRAAITGTLPIDYNQTTGNISILLKANGGIIIEANELAVDLTGSAITGILSQTNGGTGIDGSVATNGQLLIGTGTGLVLANLTEGDAISIINGSGTISISVADDSIQENKLNITSPSAGVAGEVLTSNGTGGFEWQTNQTFTKRSWSWGAASASNINTNRYLDRNDGIPTNIAPYVAWVSCKLTSISFSAASASTWTAQVYVNGILSASLASGGAQYGFTDSLSIQINSGDRVSFYMSGVNIDTPAIDALFEEI